MSSQNSFLSFGWTVLLAGRSAPAPVKIRSKNCTVTYISSLKYVALFELLKPSWKTPKTDSGLGSAVCISSQEISGEKV